MTANSKHWVVIPAAGCGSRMQSEKPKQYLLLNDKPVLHYSLELFSHHPSIEGIVLVVNANDDDYQPIIEPYGDKVITVEGGEERFHSVKAGVDKVVEVAGNSATVLVHDAARPCLTSGDVSRLIATGQESETGALLVLPIVDTLKSISNDSVDQTHQREQFVRALTPQLAPAGLLRHALEHVIENALNVTDEAQALELVGAKMKIVVGRSDNIKITYPDDLPLASFYLQHQNKAH